MRINKTNTSVKLNKKIIDVEKKCLEKQAMVEFYIKSEKNNTLRGDNLKLLSTIKNKITIMFEQMHKYINYLQKEEILLVLKSIEERFELVDLINEDLGNRYEEYFEVLLDLPVSVNSILKLEVFEEIADFLSVNTYNLVFNKVDYTFNQNNKFTIPKIDGLIASCYNNYELIGPTLLQDDKTVISDSSLVLNIA